MPFCWGSSEQRPADLECSHSKCQWIRFKSMLPKTPQEPWPLVISMLPKSPGLLLSVADHAQVSLSCNFLFACGNFRIHPEGLRLNSRHKRTHWECPSTTMNSPNQNVTNVDIEQTVTSDCLFILGREILAAITIKVL